MKTIVPLTINGKAVNPSKTFDVINPATGAAFATVAEGDVSYLDAAIASARAAFHPGAAPPIENANLARDRGCT